MSEDWERSSDQQAAIRPKAKDVSRSGSWQSDKQHLFKWLLSTLASVALGVSAYCWGLLQGHESRLTRLETVVSEKEKSDNLREVRVDRKLETLDTKLDSLLLRSNYERR